MRAAILPVTPFAQNCTLLWCDERQVGVFVDPGGETDRLLDAAARQGVRIEAVWLTHGHLDHAGAAAEIAERLDVPVVGPHPDDAFLLDALHEQGRRYGSPARRCTPDRWLAHGDTVRVGAAAFAVLHCPGHTPGHVVFHHAPSRLALVGDVLFNGSIGRSDLPRGNHDQLVAAIRGRLFPLGDDVRFVPGHGPMSTFGRERMTNPFVADMLFE